ncbi:cellulose synthase-like protein G2 [Papaver somniferum]|uniref:cellulose synthase-like protein G2 n=1 Tax=Papaver somniferum TaxID=3469 RepID=UPI000E6F9063|nr:cellulose synthase-like protein G2 [Papaver somniferum]
MKSSLMHYHQEVEKEIKMEKKISSTADSLPLHEVQVQTLRANLNRLHSVFHTTIILSLLYYRLSRFLQEPVIPSKWPWILLFISEFIFSFIWFLTQAFRFRPAVRSTYPDRISSSSLPGIDVFICTADPTKEPTIQVMNTVLSAMSLDYPPEKLSVYLSDDSGSSLSLFSVKEAAIFAKSWIPFWNKYDIKTRCPEAYFKSSKSYDDTEHVDYDQFKLDRDEIKAASLLFSSSFSGLCHGLMSKYQNFVDRVQNESQNIATSQDRAPQVEMICENEGIPRLVYVSRERRPTYPHRFKAGALNSLLRVSGIISNAPHILVLDCDMYCNDPTSAKQAMCFYVDDPEISSSSSLAFVQFPQIFYNLSQNDIYDGQARSAFKTKWQGMDGLRGPVLSGTGFYLKRKALFDFECNDKDSSTTLSLLGEARYLASCAFENKSQWGDRIGFSYKCLLESTFTGYLLHCKGWKSAYCFPSKPNFLGCTTMNMKDAMVQTMKWCSGLFQVGFSKFSPLTYGMSRMSPLQSMCYAYFTLHPLYVVSFLIYGIIPQLYLVRGIPLFPKVSDPWFTVFVIVYMSSLCQHLVEVLISGGTIKTWWNEQRIWMIKSVTGSLFGFLDVVMKSVGVTKASFRLTNKVIDSDQQEKYEKGRFNFEGATIFMIPLFILVLWNLGCFILGLRRVFTDKSLEEMFGQVYISFLILVLSYPILEGIITRKT